MSSPMPADPTSVRTEFANRLVKKKSPGLPSASPKRNESEKKREIDKN